MNVDLYIELYIERLVLDGIDLAPGDRGRLRAAVETELGRLLSDGGVSRGLAGGAALPSLRARDLAISGPGDPTLLGQRIAGAVYGGIGE